MSAITNHATDRALERLTANGIDGNAVLSRAGKIVASRFPDRTVGLLMVRLPDKIGDVRGDFNSRDSNGEDVWAMGRFGRVTTLMLRRKEQPATPAALRVDEVYMVKGALASA